MELKRYHKNIYFEHEKELKNFNSKINAINYKFTTHFKERLFRGDTKEILLFIKDIQLKYDNIFEYYYNTNYNKIVKSVYRIKYNDINDIIMVISDKKAIITVYFNKVKDNHATLKKELYVNN